MKIKLDTKSDCIFICSQKYCIDKCFYYCKSGKSFVIDDMECIFGRKSKWKRLSDIKTKIQFQVKDHS